MKNQISDLGGALQQSNSILQQSQTALQQSQLALGDANANLVNKQTDIVDLTERNTNLKNRLTAVIAEADEKTKAADELKTQVKLMEKEKESNNVKKVLGRKSLNELGRTQVTETKKAYREEFRERINTFGSNRQLVMESLVLRDPDGERLVVNAELPRKYEDLLPAQRKRVAETSRWKDLNRVPDCVYSSVAKNGSLPAALHVKMYKKELNAGLPPITQVKPCKLLLLSVGKVFVVVVYFFFIRTKFIRTLGFKSSKN